MQALRQQASFQVREQQQQHYAPVAFDNTLGRVAPTNIRTPRALIEVPVATAPADDPESREQFEIAMRRRALLAIENTFAELLRVEAFDRKLANPRLAPNDRYNDIHLK